MSEEKQRDLTIRISFTNTNTSHAPPHALGSLHDYSIPARRPEPLVDVPSQRAHDVLHGLLW